MRTDVLAASASTFAAAKAELLAAYPSLRDDDAALADTLEGVTDFRDLAAALLQQHDEHLAGADAMKALADQYLSRAETLTTRAGKLRLGLLSAMQAAGEKTLRLPAATLSVGTGTRSVVVTDEAALPAEFMRTPEPPAPKPDKKALAEALKAGREVPGAVLSNGTPTLTVRRA